ncbi:MAG: anaerobic ribonucleoside-triphosphate reductase activating protein [Negativicutes bacterium]|nr:anaerobic ribonucleoside-triphosphate reductase activating protein [Negativicutes bacterium]
MKIRLAGIERDSVVDGPGLRLVFFAQGCIHACPHCHNPGSWSMTGGSKFSLARLKQEIDNARLIRGITLSGGEPLLQAGGMAELAAYARQKQLSVMVYTGFTWEEIIGHLRLRRRPALDKLIACTDILVDGRYIHQLRDLRLLYRGSSNQRVIDVQKTLRLGRITEIDDSELLCWC